MRGQKSLAAILGVALILLPHSDASAGTDPPAPAEWKSLDVPGLTKLAWELRRRGASGAADCRQLAGHVAEWYAAAADVGKSHHRFHMTTGPRVAPPGGRLGP